MAFVSAAQPNVAGRAQPDGDGAIGADKEVAVGIGTVQPPAHVLEEETHLLLIEPAGTPNTGDPQTAAVKTKI